MATETATKISEQNARVNSGPGLSSDNESESIKSSSSSSGGDSPDSASDSSLDSDDINLDTMSSSQFLMPGTACGGDAMIKLETMEVLEDDDPTPTSSICIPSIPSSTASAVSSTVSAVEPPMAVEALAKPELSYARDPYSPSSISHLLPPNLKEDQFVTVQEGDALVVLQELTDYLWVVKVCRTDTIGIIPAWNVEGEFERIARINMELNARVSTPVAEFPPTDNSSSSGDDSRASSPPTTPSSDISQLHEELRPTKVRKLRSVDFAASKSKVMFRYPSERYVSGEWEQAPVSASWYRGWIEGEEGEIVSLAPSTPAPALVTPAPVVTVVEQQQKPYRRGRKRNRRRVVPKSA